MTKINFDEPSDVQISASAPALKVKNKGLGEVLVSGEKLQKMELEE